MGKQMNVFLDEQRRGERNCFDFIVVQKKKILVGHDKFDNQGQDSTVGLAF